MSVHFAAHFLQSLRHQANVRKRSSAVIFFDLRSAFYRAQRSTVVRDRLGYGDSIDDEDVAISTLADPVALESVQVSDSLQMVVQELFSQTWCTVPTNGAQQPEILRSVRGTRPGDPVADLTFTCVMKQILDRFMRVALPMLPVLHTASGDLAVPAITWVDDVAIYLESADARDLLPTAKEVVQAMHQQCRMVGLDLMHGKTEKCCFDYMDVTLTPFDEICTKLAQWLLDLVIGIKFGYLLPRDIRTLVLNILQTCPLMSSLDTDWQGLGKHSLIVGSAFYKMMQSTRKPGGLSHAVLSYPGYSLVVKSGPRLQLLNFRSASNFFSKLQG